VEQQEEIQTVIARPGYYVWALGSHRAEACRVGSGNLPWRWRVWGVIGPRNLAGALARTRKIARTEALRLLARAEADHG